MNSFLSRYLFYYPVTFLKGETVRSALRDSRRFQWLDAAEIEAYQLEKAKVLLQWAKSRSPFYRARYDDLDLNSLETLADFARLPTVEKKDLIDSEEELFTGIKGSYEMKTTGGSTGQPVRVRKDARALAMERAVTWRAYEWAGISVGDPQGRFWGIPHDRKARLKAALADLVANRKRVSAFDLNDESLGRYYGQLRNFGTRYLYGYASVIEALADYVEETGAPRLPGLQSIITTSEVLYPSSREKIERAFGVRVFNEYGCGEVGSIAHECEQGSMHVMADNLLLEIDGEWEGEIIVTDLFNYQTPLIRYRLGDYARKSASTCSCGRQLPVLENIYGRAYDLIRLKNGSLIHPESLVYVVEDFKQDCDTIAQFQAVQDSIDNVTVYVVPKPGWNPTAGERLKQCMQAKVSSQLHYTINAVPHLHREKSGKMRLVKSCVGA